MVYGPGAPGNFNRLLRFIRMGIPLPFGSVRNQRSFMYVENLCDAIRACLQHPGAAGRTFLLSDGEDISTPELIRLLSKYLGRSSRLLPFPPALLEAGARMVGFRGEAERLLESLRVDSSAIRQALHWNPPYSLREGLRATAEAYLAVVEGGRAKPATHLGTCVSQALPVEKVGVLDRARPLVSIVIPMLNEEKHIGGCLDSILSGSFPLERCEVLVVDGGSVDRSREIVQDRMKQYPSIRLLENPRRVKGVAMNIGIRNARGEYILRMDAHSEYPRDYVQNCLEELERTGADNVGGSWTVVPGKPTFLAKALALTVQHPFGVGDAKYRMGGGGYVDTVPFGAFRREVFVRVGLFRENLVVHQDYEMNARIRAAGGKIYLSERIHNTYFHVSTLGGYLRKAWSYGYWSARSTLLHPYSFAWRHFASLLFVLVLLAGAGVAAFWRPAGVGVLGILGAYALLAVAASAQVGWQEGWRFVPLLPVLFFLRHITYGLGTLAGFLDHFLRPVREEELPSLQ
jgi:glycosyltransferase involved in cell wall biosynthesis